MTINAKGEDRGGLVETTAEPTRQAWALALTDTHAHLDHIGERLGTGGLERLFEVYQAHRSEAETAGKPAALLPFIVDIGTRPGDLAPRRERFGSLGFVRFSAGLWPGRESFADPAASMELLEADLSLGSCCALGECGLDYFHMEAERGQQIALFEAQAALAQARSMPLIVHSREAFQDTLAVVSGLAGAIPVIIHCFSYGAREAEAFLNAGCILSFAGNLSYRKAEPLSEALKAAAGAQAFLIETDSPYMNPMPNRGKPASPLDIGRTYAFAARTLGLEPSEVIDAVQQRSVKIFCSRPESEAARG